MANIKPAYDSLVTMTVTNLHSMSSSATGAWGSAVVDNSSNLWRDAHVMVVLDFANTAIGGSRGAFVYAYGGIESGVYTNLASGSEGTFSIPDFTSNPPLFHFLGPIWYHTQDEVAEGGPWSVCEGMRLRELPKYWGIVIINHSGASLHSANNTVKWLPIYHTVA